MRTLNVILVIGLTGPALFAQQKPLPLVDTHLHALAADAQEPPPVAMCPPFPEMPLRDAKDEWRQVILAWQKNPPRLDPVWSPASDEELMNQTLDILKRRNIIAVVSGPLEMVRRWRDAAPDRLIPGLVCSIRAEKPVAGHAQPPP